MNDVWLCDKCFVELSIGDVELYTDGNVFSVYCQCCCLTLGTKHIAHYEVRNHVHDWTLDGDYDGNVWAVCNEFRCKDTLTEADIIERVNKIERQTRK